MVLDGGSFMVTLHIRHGKPLHLFVPDPSRRHKGNVIIQIIGDHEEIIESIYPGSPETDQLHREVSAALKDPTFPVDARRDCAALEQLVARSYIPGTPVYFEERWISE